MKEFRYYDIIGSLFVAVLIISEVGTTKLFSLGPFVLPGAGILFPISYIFGDILTEVYGYARTRRVIWTGFISVILLAIVLLIIQYLPPAPSWHNQQAYEAILGFVPRIVIASILGYWIGEFLNSFVLAKMKIWTQGRMLWSRTIGSTVVGQAADSLVFAFVAFYGTVPLSVVFTIMGGTYLFKVVYETVATPLTYIIVNRIKKAEGIDTYDADTDFNPFTFK